MEKVLVNSDRYNGQYVAIKSVDDNTIVGAGNQKQIAECGGEAYYAG